MLASNWKKLSPEQRVAYRWGLVLAILGGVGLLLPGRESWHAAGPHNIGHSKIECRECHAPAPGNFAGQAFKNVLYAVGLSDSATHFVYVPAGNEECLACHDNPDDRHPVADFLQPEFATARQAMGVQFCVSCHQQHVGGRVSVTPTVCQYCHDNPAMLDKLFENQDDPVDIPHSILISDQRWETCLGCHDFHGNHDRKVPVLMSQVLSNEQIQQYFDGGESPYGHRRLTVIQTMRFKTKL